MLVRLSCSWERKQLCSCEQQHSDDKLMDVLSYRVSVTSLFENHQNQSVLVRLSCSSEGKQLCSCKQQHGDSKLMTLLCYGVSVASLVSESSESVGVYKIEL